MRNVLLCMMLLFGLPVTCSAQIFYNQAQCDAEFAIVDALETLSLHNQTQMAWPQLDDAEDWGNVAHGLYDYISMRMWGMPPWTFTEQLMDADSEYGFAQTDSVMAAGVQAVGSSQYSFAAIDYANGDYDSCMQNCWAAELSFADSANRFYNITPPSGDCVFGRAHFAAIDYEFLVQDMLSFITIAGL